MRGEKILILRTIPLANFKLFIEHIDQEMNIKNADIFVQEDLKGKIDLELKGEKINYKYIKPGKFNFIKGIKLSSFFKYDKIILPVNNYDLEDYSNLLFFLLPIISKSYFIYYPDLTFEKYSYLGILSYTIILESIAWFVLLLILPFYLLSILFIFFKNKFSC